jgi:two-component system chemotaxis response regulator CheB
VANDEPSEVGHARVASIVVVGASAGGVEALSVLVASLSPDIRAAVLVVLHVAPGGTSVLPQILMRCGRIPVDAATDGAQVERGHVYVAPPDHHLLVDDGVLRLDSGPREHGHRPSIDATMRAASAAHGDGVIAVVLSGARDDGTAGAEMVRSAGGRVVVQAPEDALFADMPLSVLAHMKPDAVLPVAEIGEWLLGATRGRPHDIVDTAA